VCGIVAALSAKEGGAGGGSGAAGRGVVCSVAARSPFAVGVHVQHRLSENDPSRPRGTKGIEIHAHPVMSNRSLARDGRGDMWCGCHAQAPARFICLTRANKAAAPPPPKTRRKVSGRQVRQRHRGVGTAVVLQQRRRHQQRRNSCPAGLHAAAFRAHARCSGLSPSPALCQPPFRRRPKPNSDGNAILAPPATMGKQRRARSREESFEAYSPEPPRLCCPTMSSGDKKMRSAVSTDSVPHPPARRRPRRATTALHQQQANKRCSARRCRRVFVQCENKIPRSSTFVPARPSGRPASSTAPRCPAALSTCRLISPPRVHA